MNFLLPAYFCIPLLPEDQLTPDQLLQPVPLKLASSFAHQLVLLLTGFQSADQSAIFSRRGLAVGGVLRTPAARRKDARRRARALLRLRF